ncbi:hypothetical protein [Klebsiella quasipneumoniae]|uniref:Uncharacterized protein n=1 Tax=Klebsiella quasipneumoniae subsp. quasipneumoniae TaxID=1667327 RepID=A0AAW8XU25_9ENTR|nr:hypothetical protein [Klebsiella quasipneumoniae]MBM5553045.1 hypothetical protein [Klebsiella quasipneumoniae]MBM5559097.1 hypothetical protein [Klebsiella quasipneumoniae]MCJ4451470.1 hypothetical protein [Klebsiella quasipneumoniae]MDV0842936.1 hypothetical protein [Klebsiella quasipneumoniae subsp. quasipneumoniae]MDZ0790394.1 hypothetical protein [Klebsiella quasipneumoniae]
MIKKYTVLALPSVVKKCAVLPRATVVKKCSVLPRATVAKKRAVLAIDKSKFQHPAIWFSIVESPLAEDYLNPD